MINRWQAAHGSEHKLVHSLISGDVVVLASSSQVHNLADGSDIRCVSVFQPGPFSSNTHDFGSEPASEGGSGYATFEGIFVDSESGKQFIYKFADMFEQYETRFIYDVLPESSFHDVRMQFTLVQVLPGRGSMWHLAAEKMIVGKVYDGSLEVHSDNHEDIIMRIPGVCRPDLYNEAAAERIKREIEDCRRQRTQEFVDAAFDMPNIPNITTCQRTDCLRKFIPPWNNKKASYCCRQCRNGRGCDHGCDRRWGHHIRSHSKAFG